MKRMNLREPAGRKIFLWGSPGSGKTTLAGSAAEIEETGPVLYVNIVDGNPVVLAEHEAAGRLLAVSLEDLADLNLLHEYFVQGQKPTHVFARTYEVTQPFSWLIFDTITQLQLDQADAVVGTQAMMNLPQKVLERPHYHQLLRTMMHFARNFYKLADTKGVNVIMVCQETANYNAANKVESYTPGLLGQALDKVWSLSTLSIRMSTIERADPLILSIMNEEEKKNRRAFIGQLFQTKLVEQVKDQDGVGKPYVYMPTMKHILELIKANA